MSIRAYGVADVVTAGPHERLADAAGRLRDKDVGCLVVTDQGCPVGVLTDRDVALAALGEGVDAAAVTVEDVMQRPAVTVADGAPLREAVQLMRERGVRRLPIVDTAGNLAGLVTADDLVSVIANELIALKSVVASQSPGRHASPATRSLHEHFEKRVVTVSQQDSARDVARLMARELVGCVVVTDSGDRPVGIITDRDLTKKALGAPEMAAGAVMSAPLAYVEPEATLELVVELMRQRGVRRMPVVKEHKLCGIVSLDDVLVALGRELADLGVAFKHAIARAEREQRLRGLRSDLHAAVDCSIERAETLGERAQERLARALRNFRKELRDYLD